MAVLLIRCPLPLPGPRQITLGKTAWFLFFFSFGNVGYWFLYPAPQEGQGSSDIASSNPPNAAALAGIARSAQALNPRKKPRRPAEP